MANQKSEISGFRCRRYECHLQAWRRTPMIACQAMQCRADKPGTGRRRECRIFMLAACRAIPVFKIAEDCFLMTFDAILDIIARLIAKMHDDILPCRPRRRRDRSADCPAAIMSKSQ